MRRIILDVMGGDNAPVALLEGAFNASFHLSKKETQLVLVGNKNIIESAICARSLTSLLQSATIVHASEVVEMSDTLKVVRSKPDSSLSVGLKIALEDKYNSAFITAGHSGVAMASALVLMKRLPGIARPALAVTIPTLNSRGCLLIDVGANIDCTPDNLYEFAIMASIFRENADRLPRIGVLSNGEEKSKGTKLTQKAYELIENSTVLKKYAQFIGYVEGKDLFDPQVDIVVMDGFVGNAVLKSLEGAVSTITTMVKDEVRTSNLAKLGVLLASKVFKRVKQRLDYDEHGGAPLLGVAGYSFICHGRSNANAISNAVIRADKAVKNGFLSKLETVMKEIVDKR